MAQLPFVRQLIRTACPSSEHNSSFVIVDVMGDPLVYKALRDVSIPFLTISDSVRVRPLRLISRRSGKHWQRSCSSRRRHCRASKLSYIQHILLNIDEFLLVQELGKGKRRKGVSTRCHLNFCKKTIKRLSSDTVDFPVQRPARQIHCLS